MRSPGNPAGTENFPTFFSAVLQELKYAHAVLEVRQQLSLLWMVSQRDLPRNLSLHCIWVLFTSIGVRFRLAGLPVRLPQLACSLRSARLSPPPTLVPRRSELEGLRTKLLLLAAPR